VLDNKNSHEKRSSSNSLARTASCFLLQAARLINPSSLVEIEE